MGEWAKEYDGWREEAPDDEPLVYIWADGVHIGLWGENDKLCALAAGEKKHRTMNPWSTSGPMVFTSAFGERTTSSAPLLLLV